MADNKHENTMKKVIGLGNALVDILIKLGSDAIIDKLGFPRGSMQLVDKQRSEKVLSNFDKNKLQYSSGGSAANTIHGLARLGIDTGFIGKVGHDPLGNIFAQDLGKSNINSHLIYTTTHTGSAIALVSPDGERTFATYLGAAVELAADDLKYDIFTGYDLLHIEGYLVQNHELMIAAMEHAKAANLKISLDLASYNVVESNLDFLKDIVTKYVDILFANEEEAKAFTGNNPQDALKELSQHCEVAVVKIGKDGSYIWSNNETVKVGVIQAEVIDTTGAGDLYAAGFLYGYLTGKTPQQSGHFGAILSGNVIEEIGAKISNNRWETIKAQIHKN